MIIISTRNRHNIFVAFSSTLCIVFIVSFFIASYAIARKSLDNSYDTLSYSTLKIESNIKTQLEKEKEKLQVLADDIFLSGDFSAASIQEYINNFKKSGLTVGLGALCENQKILYSDAECKIDTEFNFSSEALKAPYISDVKYFENGKRYIYWAVRVGSRDDVRAVLYGMMDLELLSEYYSVDVFDGNATVYLIDPNSKNIVASMYGKNVTESEILYSGIADENKILISKNAFILNKNKNTTYYSQNLKEYFFINYKYIEYKNWALLLVVKQKELYKFVYNIISVIVALALAQMLILGVYIFFMLRMTRENNSKSKKQLEQSLYMLEVQQVLFDAHKEPALITSALGKVANMLTAEVAVVLSIDSTQIRDFYYWGRKKSGYKQEFIGKSINTYIPNIYTVLARGRSAIYYAPDKSFMIGELDKKTLDRYKVNNFMLIPVLNSQNHVAGLLGTLNMELKWDDTTLLECVAGNFMMALSNLKSYNLIHKMGTEDALTGLLNRNSYQHYIRRCSVYNMASFCCIYMDANGLHELNNKYGHKAGDDMLKYIGKSLKKIFETDTIYRIGGDEFVVFCENADKQYLESMIKEFKILMEEKDYHVSIGLSWKEDDKNINTIVSEAEQRMYDDKRLYYKNLGDESKARI